MTDDIKNNDDIIRELFFDYIENIDKFLNTGNKSAGTRARKALMGMKKISTDLRKQIQDIKNQAK